MFDIHDNIKNLAGSTEARRLAIVKGLAYLEALAPDSEGDGALQAELAAGFERSGSLTGNLYDSNTEGGRAAAPILEKALALRKKVVAQRPDDVEASAALGLCILLYGNSQLSAGNISGALASYRQGLDVQKTGSPAFREHPAWLRARAQILSQVCNLSPVAGDAAGAIPVCEESSRLLDTLARRNALDKEMSHLYAMNEGRLGNALRLSGREAEAVPHFRAGIDRMRQLLSADPTNANLQHTEAATRLHLANSLVAIKDAGAAQAFAEAIAALEASLAGNSDDSRRVMVLSYALEKYSGLLLESGQRAQSEEVYARGLNLLRQMAYKPSAGAIELNNYASALAKCSFPRLANPPLALDIALRASQFTKARNPLIQETLAWAYFQNGRVEDAIATARSALAMLPAVQGPSTGLRKGIESSLSQFKARR